MQQHLGTVKGAGRFDVTDGDYDWLGGTISGPGTTIVSGGKLHLAGSDPHTLQRTTDAPNGLEWDEEGALDVAAGTTLTLGGISEVTADTEITGAGNVFAAGVFRVAGASLTSSAVLQGHGSGSTIEVQGENAALGLRSDTTQNGTIVLGEGNALSLEAGMHVFDTGSSVEGDGFVQVSDTANATFKGTLKPRVLSLLGGTSRFENAAQVTRAAIRSDVTIAEGAAITATDRIELLQHTLTLASPSSLLAAPHVKVGGDDPVLRGVGTIRGSLENDGTVQPDGTLKVEGDYTQTPNGYLWIDFLGAQSAPRLDVTGAASLGGGFLHLQLSAAASDRTFLTAASRAGEFNASTLPACSEIEYTATSVALGAEAVRSRLAGPGEVAEGSGRARFVVTLSNSSTRPVTVGYATVAGSAQEGTDFTPASGTLVFAPGTTSKTVDVVLVGDDVQEEDERFSLRLSDATNATIQDGEKFALIHDDDGGPEAQRKYKPIATGSIGIRMEPQAINHRSVVGIATLSEWPSIDQQLAFGFRFDTGQLSNIAPMGTAYDINEAGDVVGTPTRSPTATTTTSRSSARTARSGSTSPTRPATAARTCAGSTTSAG